jgi:signal transduction histidine kinase/DNA-binding LacI/PurR family transcriptional regulator/ActR/RegA family two-component response regulator
LPFTFADNLGAQLMKEDRKTSRATVGRKQNARPTIGMLINWLVGLHELQWLGAVDAARAQRANLICFSGKELERPDNFYAQAGVVFDLVSPEHLDGLIIWTTTLQQFVGQQKMVEFCQQYQPLPMISVEQVMAGLPSLVVDEKQGMFAAVSHLIEVHGLQRIAFIRGPEYHPGAQDRYQGYLEALAKHGLPFDPTLVPPALPYWFPEEAAARVHQLLDEQTTGVEAIAAANDDLALGVLLALQSRHIRIPSDVAVVGFDNYMNVERPDVGMDSTSGELAGADGKRVINIRSMTLPLTTVRSPFYELGWRSVEVMLAQLRGEEVPEVVTVPTELIVRRSCGCFSQTVRQPAPAPIVRMPRERPAGEAFGGAPAIEGEPIIAEMKQTLALPGAELAPEWADRLLTAFLQDIQGETADGFLAVLDELVRASMSSGDDLERWWPVLFALRRQTIPYLVADDVLAQAEALWQRVQLLMEEITGRFYAYRQALAEKRDQILREIGQKLITTLDIGQLAKVLAQELPNLGIQSCYVGLYEPYPADRSHGSFSFHNTSEGGSEGTVGTSEELWPSSTSYPTEWSRAILVYEHHQQIDLAAEEALFPSRQLAPGERLRRDQPYSMVVEPLYFKDQQLGFALFEVGMRQGWIYEVLRGQLSSALQGALLVEREKHALAAVEDAKHHVEVALDERARLLAQSQEQNRLLHQEIRQRQQVEAALQKAHDELEQRVAERTAELAHANEILTQQIVERERAESIQANLEAQLRQAQKMEAIGRLAGGIAHDFNNLLLVISGYSDLLLTSLDAGDPVSKEDIEQILHAGERAATLTRQLLAFSRKQVLQPQILNLNSVMTNIEMMLQRLIGEDIRLDILLAPNLAPITADPGQIEQIIVNLVVNARDAMPRGGQLTLATANVVLDQEYARHRVGVQAGRYVLLRVSDTGMGMDAETQARIFEPFFTTKPQGKGTGLGLATVFGIVQQSGGHIAVVSAVGQGTSFTIYLPQAAQAVSEIALDWIRPKSSVSGAETILVVEDDPGVRAVTRRFLEEHGYTVLEASHGLDALRLCQEHPAPIHLLITDVVMPNMSGRELVARLTSTRPNLPVLYVSGYTDSAMVRHGILEASISLLQKPFTADALARKVRELLDRRPAS